MTKQEIAELADVAIKHSLFEPLEPAIVVESQGEPRQVVIPHAFIYKFAELLLETTNKEKK
jgi:hypothetical protein